jgi:hypothetical protein
MIDDPVNISALHHTIIKFIIDRGFAPEVTELSQLQRIPTEAVGRLGLLTTHGVQSLLRHH